MSASLIVLETQDFVAAARLLRLWVAAPAEAATGTLCGALQQGSAMAGSDPGGTAWAASYDRAVESALQAAVDAINAVDTLAAMFAQTAHNYESADAASHAGGRGLIEAAVASLPRAADGYWLPLCPVSAAGGSGGAPHGWGLVEQLVGYVWPNGHQDRLRAAGRAWRASSAAWRHAADDTVSAAQLAISDRIPEAADMWTVTHAMADRLGRLADVHAAIADSCDQFAAHVDEVHSAIENELGSLVTWTVGIEAAGGLLSVVSLGSAEAPTQAVEAVRIASTAARIASVIERFVAVARSCAASIAALAGRAGEVSARLRLVLDARLTEAGVMAVARYRTLRISEDIGALGRLASDEESAGAAVAAGPKPAPNFEPPTNPPQVPPTDLPPGWSVREMPATEQYPSGYWVETNQHGQPIDPSTGRPPSNVSRAQARARTHVPLPPRDGVR